MKQQQEEERATTTNSMKAELNEIKQRLQAIVKKHDDLKLMLDEKTEQEDKLKETISEKN